MSRKKDTSCQARAGGGTFDSLRLIERAPITTPRPRRLHELERFCGMQGAAKLSSMAGTARSATRTRFRRATIRFHLETAANAPAPMGLPRRDNWGSRRASSDTCNRGRPHCFRFRGFLRFTNSLPLFRLSCSMMREHSI